MPDDVQDSQDSTEIHSGDPRIWGTLSDLIIVKDLTIDTVADEQMNFTPDGVPESPRPFPPKKTGFAGARRVRRATRATINLDKAYVSQTFLSANRPITFGRKDEYNKLTDEDEHPGMNPVEMGAVGKLTDVFRVSVAKNFPFPDSELALTSLGGEGVLSEDGDPINSSYNDLFGVGASKPDLKFGRLELRIQSHFYHRDRRSGPLFFDIAPWPEDAGVKRDVGITQSSVESEFEIDVDGSVVIDPITGTPKIGMKGELLPGGLLFHPVYHAWAVLASIKKYGDCGIFNTEIIKSTREFPDLVTALGHPERPVPPGPEFTIDDRVSIFSKPKCPDLSAYKTVCKASGLTAYISCSEISLLKYNERWITITDRFNSLLSEIDNIYCAISSLDFNVDKLVLEVTKKNKVISDLLGYIKLAGLGPGIDDIIAANDAIDELVGLSTVCITTP